ncbi:MAG: dephospho-CoA kinase [Cytophagales bacterium]|jgi:dephospho-CoA kinase|nr:dephospho-CoA kinase [Cytophagales bacterium]HMR56444.1 dephospho-CoA kinase [Cyclobacteriaceae bacterium]HRE68108.1 dephospho-CoA kinase [Cyclobacteriaceae bacterium]
MAKLLQVGITGGIGSGKSLVCKIFNALGVPTYDADSRAKMVMTTDGILVEAIKKEFGILSYDAKGVLNRQHLANSVFNQPDKLKRLNELVHPRVALDYENWVSSQADVKYVLKEAALLFESGSYQSLDKIIVVTAPETLRVKRVLLRDPHRSMQQTKEIISNQMAEEEKTKRADYVIVNDETTLLIPQVLNLHLQFIA